MRPAARRSRQDLEATLRARLRDVRALLRRNVAEARPVLEALLDGKITITPTPIEVGRTRTRGSPPKRATYTVRIPLNLAGILEWENLPLSFLRHR